MSETRADGRGKYPALWAACGLVLNLVIGWVASLPLVWGILALGVLARDGWHAVAGGPAGSALIVLAISLLILIPLFILANRSLARLTGWPRKAYWPLAVILLCLPTVIVLAIS